MARKPDTPCSRCGKLLWSGSGSLPADERTCRPCRRLVPAPYGARPTTTPRAARRDQLPARPAARDLAAVVFDGAGRLMPDAKRRVKSSLRCRSDRRHLLAFVLTTPYGPWVAWRRPGPAGRWHVGWLGEVTRERAWCSCRRGQNWSVGFAWLAEQSGDVLATPDMPRWANGVDELPSNDSAVA